MFVEGGLPNSEHGVGTAKHSLGGNFLCQTELDFFTNVVDYLTL